MKRTVQWAVMLFLLLGCVWSVSAGGEGEKASAAPEKVTISVFNNQSQIVQGVLEDITAAFEAEYPNIEVDFQSVGKEYESMMKVKMASSAPEWTSTCSGEMPL